MNCTGNVTTIDGVSVKTLTCHSPLIGALLSGEYALVAGKAVGFFVVESPGSPGSPGNTGAQGIVGNWVHQETLGLQAPKGLQGFKAQLVQASPFNFTTATVLAPPLSGPTFLTLQYIIAIGGIFPSRSNRRLLQTGDNFIGQIVLVPYNFIPEGYLACDGQLVAINQNTALFSPFLERPTVETESQTLRSPIYEVQFPSLLAVLEICY